MSLTPRIDTVEDRASKNYIINGGFDFWQRGTSGTTGYIADRMQVVAATATTRSTDVPNNFSKYSMQIAQSSVQFGYFKQKIESVFTRELYDTTVTLVFWAKSTAGTSTLYVDINQADAVDNFSTVTNVYTKTLATSPSSSWTQYSYTFIVTATMAINGFEIVFVRNNTSANTTLYSQIQLNPGDRVLGFSTAGRNYPEELQLCQRYYEKSYNIDVAPGSGTSLGVVDFVSGNSAAYGTRIFFSYIQKRAAPTIKIYSTDGTVDAIRNASNLSNLAAGALQPGTRSSGAVSSVVGSAGSVYQFHWTADAEL